MELLLQGIKWLVITEVLPGMPDPCPETSETRRLGSTLHHLKMFLERVLTKASRRDNEERTG